MEYIPQFDLLIHASEYNKKHFRREKTGRKCIIDFPGCVEELVDELQIHENGIKILTFGVGQYPDGIGFP